MSVIKLMSKELAEKIADVYKRQVKSAAFLLFIRGIRKA